MIVDSWSGGICVRMNFSIWSHSRAVSSMRVPVGARILRRIWPLSTDGKKSRPSHGTIATREARQNTRIASNVSRR